MQGSITDVASILKPKYIPKNPCRHLEFCSVGTAVWFLEMYADNPIVQLLNSSRQITPLYIYIYIYIYIYVGSRLLEGAFPAYTGTQ
jgi:hypothetical protein